MQQTRNCRELRIRRDLETDAKIDENVTKQTDKEIQ